MADCSDTDVLQLSDIRWHFDLPRKLQRFRASDVTVSLPYRHRLKLLSQKAPVAEKWQTSRRGPRDCIFFPRALFTEHVEAGISFLNLVRIEEVSLPLKDMDISGETWIPVRTIRKFALTELEFTRSCFIVLRLLPIKYMHIAGGTPGSRMELFESFNYLSSK